MRFTGTRALATAVEAIAARALPLRLEPKRSTGALPRNWRTDPVSKEKGPPTGQRAPSTDYTENVAKPTKALAETVLHAPHSERNRARIVPVARMPIRLEQNRMHRGHYPPPSLVPVGGPRDNDTLYKPHSNKCRAGKDQEA